MIKVDKLPIMCWNCNVFTMKYKLNQKKCYCPNCRREWEEI